MIRSLRRRPTVALIALAVFAPLAVLAGVWARDMAGPGKPKPPATRLVSVGAAQLSVPGTWQRIPLRATGIAGLDADRAVAFETTPGLSMSAIAVFTPTVEPSLVPKELRAKLQGRVPKPRATRVAGLRAWTYPDLTAGPSGLRTDLTVLPTTAGVLALVCTSGVVLATVNDCAADVDAVAVRGAMPLVPSRSLALQLGLPAVVDRLNRARVRHRAALRAADTREAQARAARHLAADHRVARRAIHAAAGAAAAALVRDLTEVSSAYDGLRRAAEAGSPTGFAAARAAVRVAETELAGHVRQVPPPAIAPVRSGTAEAPAPGPGDTASGGVSPVVFALLTLLAVVAGAATGSSGAASRRGRSAGIKLRIAVERAGAGGRAARTARVRARRR